jgi:hypothetical protein
MKSDKIINIDLFMSDSNEAFETSKEKYQELKNSRHRHIKVIPKEQYYKVADELKLYKKFIEDSFDLESRFEDFLESEKAGVMDGGWKIK